MLRGGAAARWALRLAFLSLSGCLTGCRRDAPPASAHYVRLESLLELHPSWAQVVSLEQAGKTILQAEGAQAAVNLSTPPLPPVVIAPRSAPGQLRRERQARIAEEARQRIQRGTETLRQLDIEIVRRAERLAQREFEARLAAEQERIEAEIPDRQERIRREFNRRINRLGYKEVAYISQTRVYKGEVLAETMKKLATVRAAIETLKSERDAALAQVEAEAASRLAAARSRLEQEQRQRIASLREELEERRIQRQRELERLTQQQMERVEESLRIAQRLPGGTTPQPIPSSASEAPAPPPAPEARAPAAFAQAAATLESAEQRLQANLEAQKARLVGVIRNDTLKAARQIARHQGWTLVAEGARGATDGTAAVAEALREQWQR